MCLVLYNQRCPGTRVAESVSDGLDSTVFEHTANTVMSHVFLRNLFDDRIGCCETNRITIKMFSLERLFESEMIYFPR